MGPSKRPPVWVMLLVGLHLLLIGAYTFPDRMVPDRLHILGQRYARPLFHQQWELFAPDPPICSCELQAGVSGGGWRSLVRQGDGYLDRRMAQGIARYVQLDVQAGRVEPDPRMVAAMQAMVRDTIWESDVLVSRLVEQCIVDPRHPHKRTQRITLLTIP